MANKISRRSFLKGAAGISAMGLLAGTAAIPALAESEKDTNAYVNMPEVWDYEADVIVIGTGTSCYGAIKLADSGLSVIALDAYATAGGTTGISGGMQWLPNTHFSQLFGDDREKSLTYVKFMRKTAPITDAQCEAFVDTAGPMLDYITPILESTSAGVVATQTAGFGDFYPEWEGGLTEGRTVDFRIPGNAFGAADWRKAYLEAQEKLGVQFSLKTRAKKFVYRIDTNGVPEVLGVIAEKDGADVAFKARKAVLLNTGGFDWDEELCNTYLATPTKYACSLNTNDGDGLRMAMALGSNLCNMTETFGHMSYEVKAEEQRAMGVPVNIMYERMMPRQIIVNSKGRRFINEATDYDSSWRAMAGYKTYGDHDLENVPCWIVLDRKHVDDYGFKVSAYIGDVDERGVPPYFIEGATLRELAEKCGINPDGLEDEVAKFNGYCENLYDPDFHRGETPYGWHFFSDSSKPEGPERNLGPITEPPFYAARLAPSMLGTCGGPKLDEHARVMHISGANVARLYACGNCSGFGGPGPCYGGAGGTIGPGLVMGYLAANDIIDNIKENWDGSDVTGTATKLESQNVSSAESGLDPYGDKGFGTETAVAASYNPGTYTASAQGMGTVTVTMTFSGDAITDVRIDGAGETAGIGSVAIEELAGQIMRTQSVQVDTISAATITSNAVIQAAADCVRQATR
ncbi:MAG: FAD-binding protein [Clostridia bacterium]|nr:FAD-binding protein [Clostridia bacterium]